MCTWFQWKIDNEPRWIENVWFSDETHFLLTGNVNSKNCVYWSSHPPDYVLERPLHSVTCIAWVAFNANGLIGPFWFQDDEGNAQSVTKERYVQVLEQFWNELGWRRINRQHMWFQQDGATPHTANLSLAWLQDRFGNRIISQRMAVEWAAHSPDLTPLDFFLWGHLKNNVYTTRPQTIYQLQQNIAERWEASQLKHVSVFCRTSREEFSFVLSVMEST